MKIKTIIKILIILLLFINSKQNDLERFGLKNKVSLWVEKKYIFDDNNSKTLDKTIIISFNEDGYIKERQILDNDEKLKEKEKYVYDENNKLKEIFKVSINDDLLDHTIIYYKDNYNEEHITFDNNKYFINKTIYRYNENYFVESKKTYSKDDNKWFECIYKRDKHGNCIEQYQYYNHFFMNKSKYKYDKNNNLIEWLEYDKTYKLFSKRTMYYKNNKKYLSKFTEKRRNKNIKHSIIYMYDANDYLI